MKTMELKEAEGELLNKSRSWRNRSGMNIMMLFWGQIRSITWWSIFSLCRRCAGR